jgi:hypothetical protein
MKDRRILVFPLCVTLALCLFYECGQTKTEKSSSPPSKEKIQLDKANAEILALKTENARLARKLHDTRNTMENNARNIKDFLRDKQIALWDVVEADNDFSLVRAKKLPRSTKTLAAVIKAFNSEQSPDLRLSLIRIEGKTAHIKIQKDEVLTQQMGSTGPYNYMAMVTATITSFPGIDSVWLHIGEGDHWGPGECSRMDFLDLFIAGEEKDYFHPSK